jgi:hypothetical protein
MNDRDWRFADAARVIEESLALRTVRAACSTLEEAAAHSRAAAGLRRTASIFRLAPLPIRVRNLAILMATACLTHLMLTQWMPRRLAPAVPAAWWIAAGLAAAAVAVAAAPLTNAWLHRRP